MESLTELAEALGLRVEYVHGPAEIAAVVGATLLIDDASPQCEAQDAAMRALAAFVRRGAIPLP